MKISSFFSHMLGISPIDKNSSKEAVIAAMKENSSNAVKILSQANERVQEDEETLNALKKINIVEAYNFKVSRAKDNADAIFKEFAGMVNEKKVPGQLSIGWIILQDPRCLERDRFRSVVAKVEEELPGKLEDEILQKVRNGEFKADKKLAIGKYEFTQDGLGFEFHSFSEKFWKDLCLEDPYYLQYAPVSLKGNKDYIMSYLEKYPDRARSTYLSIVTPELKDNKEFTTFVTTLITKNPLAPDFPLDDYAKQPNFFAGEEEQIRQQTFEKNRLLEIKENKYPINKFEAVGQIETGNYDYVFASIPFLKIFGRSFAYMMRITSNTHRRKSEGIKST